MSTKQTPSAAAIRAAEVIYKANGPGVNWLAKCIDDETGLPDLLAACERAIGAAVCMNDEALSWDGEDDERAAVLRKCAADICFAITDNRELVSTDDARAAIAKARQ